MSFAKATLRLVSDKPANPPIDAESPVPVQINPATLRLQATASVDSGKDAGRARSQYQGTTSTLTFDLVFDTSDEGTTEDPIDVRSRTSMVERFVWPAPPKNSPPRVEFAYGTLTVVGTMTSFNMDLDLFSASGVPLRAKCAVTIKEQKPNFDLVKEGAGAKTATGATSPLQPNTAASNGAGTTSPPPTDRTGTALAGETASSFANRMGLDPRAWKGLQGVTDPLNLQAGQQINFPSTLSLDAGLGVQVGAAAGVDGAGTGAASTSGISGGAASGSAGAVPPSLSVDGRDLTSAGGLGKALNQAATSRAGAAATAASGAFSGPADAPARPPSPSGLTASGGSTGGSRSSTTGASPSPSTAAMAGPPDTRAFGYGFGVPLRPRVGVAGPATLGLVHERSRLVWSGGELPPQSRDTSVPSWLALAADLTTSVASPCGCGRAPADTTCGCGGPS
jgi:hypothetical protein